MLENFKYNVLVLKCKQFVTIKVRYAILHVIKLSIDCLLVSWQIMLFLLCRQQHSSRYCPCIVCCHTTKQWQTSNFWGAPGQNWSFDKRIRNGTGTQTSGGTYLYYSKVSGILRGSKLIKRTSYIWGYHFYHIHTCEDFIFDNILILRLCL